MSPKNAMDSKPNGQAGISGAASALASVQGCTAPGARAESSLARSTRLS